MPHRIRLVARMRALSLSRAIVMGAVFAVGLVAACDESTEGSGIALNASSSGIVLTFPDGGAATITVPIAIEGVPGVVRMTASPSRLPAAGASTSLEAVIASDAGARTIAWTANPPCTGTFSSPSSESTQFTLDALPPSPSCTLAVRVTGTGSSAATGQITLAVGPVPPVDAGSNLPPVVDLSVVSTDAPQGGEEVVLRVQAHDPDGPTATVEWTASAGALSTASTTNGESEVVWTAPACPASTSTVTAKVTDGDDAVTTKVFSFMTECP